jgi:hypothetical protein
MICDGSIFISKEEPYKQLPCHHCGSTKMFINPGDEDAVIDRLKRPKQAKLNFPSDNA